MDYLAKARLHLAQHPARPAILVLGGSFNPIHNSHIQMFVSAAEALRQNGAISIISVICAARQCRIKPVDIEQGWTFSVGSSPLPPTTTSQKKVQVLFVVVLQIVFFRLTIWLLFPDVSLAIPAELRFQLCSAATMANAFISVIPHVEGCILPTATAPLTHPCSPVKYVVTAYAT